MSNAITKFDDLSIEIFGEIFDYLNVDDCFNSFYQLNSKLNGTFKSIGYSVDLTTVSRRKFNEFYKRIILSEYKGQIRKLQFDNNLTIGLIDTFFNNFQLENFKQLRSLTLRKPSYTVLSRLVLSILHLEQLEHISIEANVYPTNFLKSIATKSQSLKSCYLVGLIILEEFDFQSNIQYLTVTVEHIEILINLLVSFPHVTYFHVSLQSTIYSEKDDLPEFNMINCENLEKFKISVLDKSMIDFNEIEHIFQYISFSNLKQFSYNCATNSLEHVDVYRWNKILSINLLNIINFHLFVQIPCDSCSHDDIQQIFDEIQTNICRSYSFSLSNDYRHYMIHSDKYPKTYFYVLDELKSGQHIHHDSIYSETSNQFPKVNSLFIENDAITCSTVLPRTIQYLNISGELHDKNLNLCLINCSSQLRSLKIFGLPSDLPLMVNLREIMIQRAMFKAEMIETLSYLCPRLEILTIEIHSIPSFQEILNQIQFNSTLSELKFLRVFSRDTKYTWSSWFAQTQISLNTVYEVKGDFLFIWL